MRIRKPRSNAACEAGALDSTRERGTAHRGTKKRLPVRVRRPDARRNSRDGALIHAPQATIRTCRRIERQAAELIPRTASFACQGKRANQTEKRSPWGQTRRTRDKQTVFATVSANSTRKNTGTRCTAAPCMFVYCLRKVGILIVRRFKECLQRGRLTKKRRSGKNTLSSKARSTKIGRLPHA